MTDDPSTVASWSRPDPPSDWGCVVAAGVVCSLALNVFQAAFNYLDRESSRAESTRSIRILEEIRARQAERDARR